MRWLTVSVIVLPFFSSLSSAKETKCNTPKHYQELGCTPILKDGEKCPSSYNCDHLQKFGDGKCHYRKGVYSGSNQVPKEQLPPCITGADCIEGSLFMIDLVDCNSNRTTPLPNETCVEFETASCCDRKVCGKEMEKLHVCYAEGQKFYEGQLWSTKEDKCMQCTCDEKWNNSTDIYENKNCKPKDCFEDFYNLRGYKSRCAAWYWNDETCCPVEPLCPVPNKNYEIIKATKRPANSDLRCKFGPLELLVGDAIGNAINCFDCKCVTPPLVECHRIKDCALRGKTKDLISHK